MLLSIIQQNYDCAWQLLHAKADPNLSSEQHGSPIYQSVLQNAVRTLKQLLQYGAVVQYVDKQGATAFHIASRLKRHECLACLLETKPDVLLSDMKGNTPMHDAIIHNDYSAARMLMQVDNCFIHRNNDGFTPIELAKHLGNDDIFLLLSSVPNINGKVPDDIGYNNDGNIYNDIEDKNTIINNYSKLQIPSIETYKSTVENFQTKYLNNIYEESASVGYYDSPNIAYWEEHLDEKSNDTYWFNTKTGESSWDIPDVISDFYHRRKGEDNNYNKNADEELRQITNSSPMTQSIVGEGINIDKTKKKHLEITSDIEEWTSYRA